MKIEDDDLLNDFRRAGKCEWCGKRKDRREPHHVLTRGMGGATRLDVPLNLVGLCPLCHRAHHDGNEPLTADLLAVVAAREGLTQDEVLTELYRLRRS